MPTVDVEPDPRTASRGLLSQALEARIAAPCLPVAYGSKCIRRPRVPMSYRCVCRIQAALRSAVNGLCPLVSAAIWIGPSWGGCFVAMLAISDVELYQVQVLKGAICGSTPAWCAGMQSDGYSMESMGVSIWLVKALPDVASAEAASFAEHESEFDDALTSSAFMWDVRFEGVRIVSQYIGGAHVR